MRTFSIREEFVREVEARLDERNEDA